VRLYRQEITTRLSCRFNFLAIRPAHAQVASNGNDDKIAGSKPNDFKDFGEQ
jgi:hypothetical protein